MSCSNTTWILVNYTDDDVVVGKKAVAKYLKEWLADTDLDKPYEVDEVDEVMESENIYVYEAPSPLIIDEGEYAISHGPFVDRFIPRIVFNMTNHRHIDSLVKVADILKLF